MGYGDQAQVSGLCSMKSTKKSLRPIKYTLTKYTPTHQIYSVANNLGVKLGPPYDKK